MKSPYIKKHIKRHQPRPFKKIIKNMKQLQISSKDNQMMDIDSDDNNKMDID